MTLEVAQFGLLLAGWIVAFLLGRELHSGYLAWRAWTSERPRRS